MRSIILTLGLLILYGGVAVANDTIRYVALGDSYTIGTGATDPMDSWPAQVVRRLKAKGVAIDLVANLAQNGWTTEEVIAYELPQLKKLNANFVSILIGTNDWVHGTDSHTFQKNIQYIFNQLHTIVVNPQNVLIVTVPDFSVTPVAAQFSGGRDIAKGLDEFNQILVTQAKEFSFRVVDICPLSKTLAPLVSNDGLHPSTKGYQRWADEIEAAFPHTIDHKE